MKTLSTKIRIKTAEELVDPVNGKFYYNLITDTYEPIYGCFNNYVMTGNQVRTYGGVILSEGAYEAALFGNIKARDYLFGPDAWEYYEEPPATKAPEKCICDIKVLFDEGCSCGGFQREIAASKGPQLVHGIDYGVNEVGVNVTLEEVAVLQRALSGYKP